MQSQHDERQLNAVKDLKASAGERVVVMAEKEIAFVVKGGGVEIGGPGARSTRAWMATSQVWCEAAVNRAEERLRLHAESKKAPMRRLPCAVGVNYTGTATPPSVRCLMA